MPSLSACEMGFDCGFDVFPTLEPTPSNKEPFEHFLKEVLSTYSAADEVKEDGAYIVFPVGEHPRIPFRCEYFMRFSSKVSSNSTAATEPYIRGVFKIAKNWFSDRVHFWHEMNETDDHRQWGYYDWNPIYEARRKMKEEEEKRGSGMQDGSNKESGESKNKGKEERKKRDIERGEKREKEESNVERRSDETGIKSKWYVVRPIPGKGQGVLATTKIPRGTRILRESPILRVPRDTSDREALTKLIATELENVDKETQRAFFSLHSAFRIGGQNPLLGIVRTNTLPLGSGAAEGGSFLVASRINHSCCHNSQNTWNGNLNSRFLTSTVRKPTASGGQY